MSTGFSSLFTQSRSLSEGYAVWALPAGGQGQD